MQREAEKEENQKIAQDLDKVDFQQLREEYLESKMAQLADDEEDEGLEEEENEQEQHEGSAEFELEEEDEGDFEENGDHSQVEEGAHSCSKSSGQRHSRGWPSYPQA